MSRVDDDRDAARLAQRLALEKQQEARKADAKASESAFARLMQEQKQAEAKPKAQRSAEGAPQPPSTGKKDEPRRPPVPSRFASRLSQGEMAEQLKQKSQQGQDADVRGRNTDRSSARGKTESRQGDAAVTDRALKERSGEGETSGISALEGGRAERGPIRTGGDKGGGGGGGGDRDGKGGSQGAQPGFRFNPALMAPVPVAAPRDTAKLEKLRKLAEEIAQKIVERARVGTNAAGQAEMQIDLRSSVLAGLSMKISCSNGRIRASFAGTDREVVKMLRENESALRSTLESRGLRLEEFKVEERA